MLTHLDANSSVQSFSHIAQLFKRILQHLQQELWGNEQGTMTLAALL